MEDMFKKLPEPSARAKESINDLFAPYLFYSKEKQYYHDCVGIRRCEPVIKCTCTHCNSSFSVREEELTTYPEGGINHGCKVLCPKCLTEATAKHRSYGKKKLNEHHYVVAFCRESKNKVWLRGYYCQKGYYNYLTGAEAETPEVEYGEEYRYLLRPKQKARCWVKEYHYVSNYKGEWVEINPREPFPGGLYSTPNLYDIVGFEDISRTFLRYCDIDSYFDAAEKWFYQYNQYYYCSRINPLPTRYIFDLAQYPIIESLLKAGFGEIVAERIMGRSPHLRLFNWESDTLKGFFKKFSLADAQKLKEQNAMMQGLKTLPEYRKFIKNGQIGDMLRDAEFFLGSFNGYSNFLDLVKSRKLNYQKALKTVRKAERKEIPCGTVLTIYKDYLNFAEKLGYQMESEIVTYPKDLYKAHDTASKLITAMEREREEKEMQAVTEANIKKYSFEYGDFCIVVPRTMEEIIEEGQKLCHCVGGYAERHAQGKTTILFIRRKDAPSVNYVTMEVIGKKIQQYHGFKNDRVKPLSKEVIKFVQMFKKYISNPKAYMKEIEKVRKSA